MLQVHDLYNCVLLIALQFASLQFRRINFVFTCIVNSHDYVTHKDLLLIFSSLQALAVHMAAISVMDSYIAS